MQPVARQLQQLDYNNGNGDVFYVFRAGDVFYVFRAEELS
jgi:hypothetical protein